MEKRKYKNYIFDLYGTLVDIRTDEDTPALWEEMANHYGLHGAAYRPEELRKVYLRIVGEKAQGLTPLCQDVHEAHPEIQIEYVFQTLYEEKDAKVSMEQAIDTGRRFRELSTKYIRLYDGARELLQELRDRGFGIYLLSNAQRIFTEYELDRLGITSFFDGIYLSSDYGCKKPDRRFFEILLHEHKISPEDTVMIGNDGVCDIQGAQAVGLAALYIRSNISPQEPFPQADYVLKEMDLRRVMEILI